jgi:hypothetical protein
MIYNFFLNLRFYLPILFISQYSIFYLKEEKQLFYSIFFCKCIHKVCCILYIIISVYCIHCPSIQTWIMVTTNRGARKFHRSSSVIWQQPVVMRSLLLQLVKRTRQCRMHREVHVQPYVQYRKASNVGRAIDVLRIPMRVEKGDWIGRSFGWDQKNRGSVSQQRPVQQSRECSLLNGNVRHSSEASACEQSRALASAEQASEDCLLTKNHQFIGIL